MSKAKAPEWLVKAVEYALLDVDVVLSGTEDQIVADAICQAIQDNPIVPTDEQIQSTCEAISEDWKVGEPFADTYRDLLTEWQRQMFRSEPDVPEEIKDLLDPLDPEYKFMANRHIIEAYRRGKASK